MAKRRPVRARPAPHKVKRSRTIARSGGKKNSRSPVARPGGRGQGPAPVPVVRKGYLEAVALYEAGLRALQRHEYVQAARLLESILKDYPDEKELNDRARLYLNVCQRHMVVPGKVTSSSVEEQLYAATLALNAGAYDQTLALVDSVLIREPANDHALYVRSVAQTLSGKFADAIPSLMRAIELNPENRSLARQDPDFDALRRDDRFRQTLDMAVTVPRSEKRRGSSRGRPSR